MLGRKNGFSKKIILVKRIFLQEAEKEVLLFCFNPNYLQRINKIICATLFITLENAII
jgi:hypothetical protein